MRDQARILSPLTPNQAQIVSKEAFKIVTFDMPPEGVSCQNVNTESPRGGSCTGSGNLKMAVEGEYELKVPYKAGVDG